EPIDADHRRGERIPLCSDQGTEPDAGKEGKHDLAEDEGEDDRDERRQEAEPAGFDGHLRVCSGIEGTGRAAGSGAPSRSGRRPKVGNRGARVKRGHLVTLTLSDPLRSLRPDETSCHATASLNERGTA